MKSELDAPHFADETVAFEYVEARLWPDGPVCPHCGTRIVGHGVEHDGAIFCCVHCARHEGVKGLVDRD